MSDEQNARGPLVTVADFEALPGVIRAENNGPGAALIVVEPGTDTDAIQARSVTGAVLEFAEESRTGTPNRWSAFTDDEVAALNEAFAFAASDVAGDFTDRPAVDLQVEVIEEIDRRRAIRTT